MDRDAMRRIRHLTRLGLGAGLAFFASQAPAAVLVLEGETQTPAQARPPGDLQPKPIDEPAKAAPIDKATAPAPNAASDSAAGGATPTPRPLDSAANKIGNSAKVSVELRPSQTVAVGTTVSFRVSSKKAGYIVLMDVDATGHLTQIYPNTASLRRVKQKNGNFIKAGGTLSIPIPTDPYAGVRYVVSPPNGEAMIVAILSAQPVQILDLPDIPTGTGDRSAVLSFLSQQVSELRIPDNANRLSEAKWSLSATPYVIQ